MSCPLVFSLFKKHEKNDCKKKKKSEKKFMKKKKKKVWFGFDKYPFKVEVGHEVGWGNLPY